VTRWYLDTEFNEDGKTIELISIALVSESGLTYYAHSSEYDVGACNDWVQANVLPHLAELSPIPRAQIATDIRRLVLHGEKPEFWAYFADYDWVVLCQLFGRMLDLPTGFPMYCRDLKQLMDHYGLKKEHLPTQPKAHDALADAQWVRSAHNYILSLRSGL